MDLLAESIDLDQVEDLADKCHQVYTILMHLTEGEANDIVSNSGEHGLEAWRKLCRRWNPIHRAGRSAAQKGALT